MLSSKNLLRGIEEAAREFEYTVLDSIPVDTGKLKQSVSVTSTIDGIELYAEDYIYYLKAKHTIYRTDGKSLTGEIVQSIMGKLDEPLPDIYSEELNIDLITEGFNKDIDTWLRQK